MTEAGTAHAMTAEDLIARAQQQPVRLLLDTNAVFSPRRLDRLAVTVNQLNSAAGSTRIRLLVSTVVHAEKLFDLRHQFKEAFDIATVLEGLVASGLQVLPFEIRHADATAALLARSFATRDAWREAKCKRCVDCLGLGHAGMTTPGKGTTCSATVDWLIAGHALAEECILVTDDRGVEFRHVASKVRLATLEAALQGMLAALSAVPGPR